MLKRNVVSLRREWRLFDKDNSSADVFLALVERMIDVGEFLLAHDVAKAGLKIPKNHKILSQKAAHALVQSRFSTIGYPSSGRSWFHLGLEMWKHKVSLPVPTKIFVKTLQTPQKNNIMPTLPLPVMSRVISVMIPSWPVTEKSADNLYYPCINVAFMHFVCMNYEKAREYAETARKLCQEIIDSGKSNYWVQATIAEAYLLLGELEYSLEAYKRAVQLEDAKPSYIASTRKQALQISSLYEEESIRSHIVDAFPTLGIVACSGHLIDNPGKRRRFPQEAEEIVRRKIDEKLDKLQATCGYSSAGCGTDLIFLEAMQERGGETHIFLPFAKDKFIQTSVHRAGTDWTSRFEKALDYATSVHYVTNEGYYGDDTLFSFCNDVMLGFAAMRGRGLNEDPNLLLFWDGNPGETGGTGEIANSWRSTFNEPEVINANEVLELLDGVTVEPPLPTGDTKPIFMQSFGESVAAMRSVKTMLFADVEAFTKVDEDKTTQFVEVFHGNVSRMMDELNCKPAFLNSWGDSFFAVFDDLNDALKLSMAIRDFFANGRWDDLASDGKLDVRISMHAGPVYEEFDPILKKRNFFGRHVNQAARIEPIVLPGSVFVSESVAALISYRYQEFDFEYAGNLELAKDFGAYPVYILQRKGY